MWSQQDIHPPPPPIQLSQQLTFNSPNVNVSVTPVLQDKLRQLSPIVWVGSAVQGWRREREEVSLPGRSVCTPITGCTGEGRKPEPPPSSLTQCACLTSCFDTEPFNTQLMEMRSAPPPPPCWVESYVAGFFFFFFFSSQGKINRFNRKRKNKTKQKTAETESTFTRLQVTFRLKRMTKKLTTI